MAVECTPDALQAAAQPYCCIPKPVQDQVMIYLLNVISGLNLTPEQLIEQAKSYQVIPKGMEDAVMLYLLCQAVNALEA